MQAIEQIARDVPRPAGAFMILLAFLIAGGIDRINPMLRGAEEMAALLGQAPWPSDTTLVAFLVIKLLAVLLTAALFTGGFSSLARE